MNLIALNHAGSFRLFAAIFFFLFSFSFQFEARSQCEASVEWNISPMPSADNPDYSPTDIVDVCVEVEGLFSDGAWLHGISIYIPQGWELIGPGTKSGCGDGEWIYSTNEINPPYNYGSGFYYDANDDGNSNNNFGASCQNGEFCFQIIMVDLAPEEAEELSGVPITPGVLVLSDAWLAPDWTGYTCSIEDIAHYPDFDIEYIYSGPEIGGIVAPNAGDCIPEYAEIVFFEAGTENIVSSIYTSIASDGSFSVYGHQEGNFDIGISVDGYLSQLMSGVEIVNGQNDVGSISLVSGDLNGDNQVNIVDVSLLGIAFGYEILDTYYDSTADLNCDGSVNIQDVSILGGAFGMVGE